MTTPRSNFDAAKAFVEYGLSEKREGRRESASGPGSALSATTECLELLDEVIARHDIKTILDLGCGDWHWMRLANWRKGKDIVSYEGWDAHPGLVDHLNQLYGDERTRFRLADITTEPLPQVDLVICRDVLFHLPLDLGARVVEQLKGRDTMLISTSFQNVGENAGIKPYMAIENWGFYHINLDIAPFGLRPYRLRAIPEAVSAILEHERSICLYDMKAERRE
jgi:SAM-dependent methyltransferase